MFYGKYRLLCRFENEAFLPYYKGSTFRGVFGRALKKVVCVLKQQECRQCLLKEHCVYIKVFELPTPSQNTLNISGVSRPHPFVIEPPDTVETHFYPESNFEFNLLLFGETNNYLPYFIYAFDQMSRIGIGKKINGRRAEFRLKAVTLGDQPIYSDIDKQLKNPADLPFLKLCESEKPEIVSRIKLTLETPLRLKSKNHLKAELPFHVLMRGMLRRISALSAFYGNGEPSLDYRGFVKQAEAIEIAEEHLEWFDWRRYSFRQDQSMLMGGLIGSIEYKGEIGEFMPLVRFCESVHIGKQTTFGLGKIRAEILK